MKQIITSIETDELIQTLFVGMEVIQRHDKLVGTSAWNENLSSYGNVFIKLLSKHVDKYLTNLYDDTENTNMIMEGNETFYKSALKLNMEQKLKMAEVMEAVVSNQDVKIEINEKRA